MPVTTKSLEATLQSVVCNEQPIYPIKCFLMSHLLLLMVVIHPGQAKNVKKEISQTWH